MNVLSKRLETRLSCGRFPFPVWKWNLLRIGRGRIHEVIIEIHLDEYQQKIAVSLWMEGNPLNRMYEKLWKWIMSKFLKKKFSFSIREQSSASLNCLRWYRSTSADFHRLAWMKTDEWLTLEASASETLNGGRFTSSNRLIKPDYLVVFLIDTAQQIL